MVAQRLSILSVLFLTACYAQASKPVVEIDNNLSDCIKIEKNEITNFSNIISMKLDYSILKPTAECGCKSMISSYSSFIYIDKHQSGLISGKLVFDSRSIDIPLALNAKLIDKNTVHVSISCALAE